MSHLDSTGIGRNPQQQHEKPLPSSDQACNNVDHSPETLSDVGGRCVLRDSEASHSLDLTQDQTGREASGRDPLGGSRDASGPSRADVAAAEFESICYQSEKENSSTPKPSNTGVSSSHCQHESGGLDTLEVSLFGAWQIGQFDDLGKRLDEAQKRAQSGIDGAYIVSPEGDHLTVCAHGVKHGISCRWLLEWEGTRIAIVNRWGYSEHMLSVHVTIGSVRLMDVGHVVAWQSVCALLKSLGFDLVRNVPGRADLCVDLAEVTMREVQAAVTQHRTICRARKHRIYGNRANDTFETYQIGSGPIMLRIYDKALEVRNDPVKLALLVERRWGYMPSSAIRIEYQLRNKALKRHFSISSVEELFENLGTIAEWATKNWFRMTKRPVDRKNKNQARAGLSDLWIKVQEAFGSWTSAPLERSPLPRKIRPDLKALKRQATGCFASALAHFNDAVDPVKEVVKWLKESKEDLVSSVAEKRMKLAAASRVAPALSDSDIPF